MIEAKGLLKRYGATTAVDDLSFTVRPGIVTGFLGPNGSGKSTTMRMILGLDHPDRGTVLIDGRPYEELARPLCEVGALLEARSAHPGRSARNHLLALARSNRLADARVDEVLGLVGLTHVANRRVGTFSLGMGQRLGIAGALLGDPPVLLFDEPVNGLDPEGIQWVRGLLRSLATEGRTVFVSSHLMSEMALTADHVVVIGKVHLLEDADITTLTSRVAATVLVRSPELDRLAVLLRGAGGEAHPTPEGALEVAGLDAASIGELAAANGLVLHELTPRRASLEEAFMTITRDHVEFVPE